MSIGNIVTRLGAPEYIITHGFGFTNINVVVNAQPIRLDFTLEATLQITQPTKVVVAPIRLQFNLQGIPVVVPGTKVVVDPIRLNFQLRGNSYGPDIFILDLGARVNLQPRFQAVINTKLTFLTPVELEEEVMRVRIT